MRHESTIKRRNPSGEIVWLARYTGRDGKRRVAKPTWNRGKGTFRRKGEAQKAIDEAYGLSDRPDTLGEYFATWIERHPRSERTNATYEHRISRVTDVGARDRLWRERTFYRDLWKPAREASDLDIRPTSAATATSRTCGPLESTTPI